MLKYKINAFILDVGCLYMQQNKKYLVLLFFTSTHTVSNPSHFMVRLLRLLDERDVLT